MKLLLTCVLFGIGLELISSTCIERSLRPHENDCKKFYYCQNGEFNEKTCNKGLEFNTEIKVCDIPERAQCTVDTASRRSVLCAKGALHCKPPSTRPPPVTCPPHHHPTCHPPPATCPPPHPGPCPPGPTGPPPTVYPRCPKEPVNPCEPPVLLPVYNCSQFIICDNFGIGHRMDCAPAKPRLIFDPETQRCEWPYDTDRRNCTIH